MPKESLEAELSLRAGVRVRPDLVFAERRDAGQTTWVVKDPVTLRYFDFGPSEVFIMKRIDGHRSLATIKSEYDEHFAPHRISKREIASFSHSLYQRGLLIASADNQAEGLLQRRGKQRLLQWASLPLQVLAIRLPGIDPEKFLSATQWSVRWLFHRATVIIVLCMALAVCVLGLLHAETIAARLPDQSQFFRGENLLYLMLTLVVTKVLHELGHAYACKYHGGECHQIGVLLMVFAPAMYCDVSDAWLFPKRSQRIGVSAAGMYVEVLLATICAVLWYFAESGPMAEWLLNVVFVCGVSTVLVNANPLLRYDGYYILSDMLNLPNLSSRSSNALWGPIRNWFLRFPRTTPREPRAVTLRIYAVCALVYRVLVFGLILYFLYTAFRQNDLLPLWHLIVVLFLGGLLLRPAIGLVQWSKRPKGRGDAMRKNRVAIAAGLLCVAVVMLGMIPVPSRLHVPVIAELDSDHRVYVRFDGRVVEAILVDQEVKAGDILAVLQNDELKSRLLESEGEIAIQKQHLENLRWRANNNREVASQIPTAESSLADLLQQREVWERQREQLTIRAPADGTVISAPRKFDLRSSDRFLPSWTGNPLDPANRGCLVQRGDLLCLIGNATALQARLIVQQDQVELIQPGDSVAILFDGTSLQTVYGRVREVSADQGAEIPRNLAADETLGAQRQKDGTLALPRGVYSALVELDDVSGTTILPGTCGRAVVIGRSQTVWQIITRFIQLNFRFFA